MEALGAVRSTQLQFWVPHENDQRSLGIVKPIWNHLAEFDMLRSTKECTVAAPDCACRAFIQESL